MCGDVDACCLRAHVEPMCRSGVGGARSEQPEDIELTRGEADGPRRQPARPAAAGAAGRVSREGQPGASGEALDLPPQRHVVLAQPRMRRRARLGVVAPPVGRGGTPRVASRRRRRDAVRRATPTCPWPPAMQPLRRCGAAGRARRRTWRRKPYRGRGRGDRRSSPPRRPTAAAAERPLGGRVRGLRRRGRRRPRRRERASCRRATAIAGTPNPRPDLVDPVPSRLSAAATTGRRRRRSPPARARPPRR